MGFRWRARRRSGAARERWSRRQSAPPAAGGFGGHRGRTAGERRRRRRAPQREHPERRARRSCSTPTRGSYTWVAATVGANQAAGYQLATDDPVMAIGGFNGTDPTPTLAQFQQYVRGGPDPLLHRWWRLRRLRRRRPGGTTSTSAQISSWVSANFTSQTVGGVTVYDLTTGAA